VYNDVIWDERAEQHEGMFAFVIIESSKNPSIGHFSKSHDLEGEAPPQPSLEAQLFGTHPDPSGSPEQGVQCSVSHPPPLALSVQ